MDGTSQIYLRGGEECFAIQEREGGFVQVWGTLVQGFFVQVANSVQVSAWWVGFADSAV